MRTWKIPIVSGQHAGQTVNVPDHGGRPSMVYTVPTERGGIFGVCEYRLKEIRADLDNSTIYVYVYVREG